MVAGASASLWASSATPSGPVRARVRRTPSVALAEPGFEERALHRLQLAQLGAAAPEAADERRQQLEQLVEIVVDRPLSHRSLGGLCCTSS